MLHAPLSNPKRGFLEERASAGLRLARLTKDHYERIAILIRSFDEHPRAEPLVALGEILVSKQWFTWAYSVLLQACRYPLPTDRELFVHADTFNYKRWHLLGRAAFYVNEMAVGKYAVQKALRAYPESKIDIANLKF